MPNESIAPDCVLKGRFLPITPFPRVVHPHQRLREFAGERRLGMRDQLLGNAVATPWRIGSTRWRSIQCDTGHRNRNVGFIYAPTP
jgi:hypothetical protein